MPITVLPRATDPDGTALAQSRLTAEIGQPCSAIMLILGEGPDVNRVVEVGAARARINPLRRKVVWAPDIDVLTPQQIQEYSPGEEAAAFIGLDNKVAMRLKPAFAQMPFKVEQAFTRAGG